MRTDLYTKTLLSLIAGLLHIEPGYTTLRKPDGTAQLNGKVVVNRRTGEIWGFRTLGPSPYPIDTVNTEPPISKPMYLGKFDFSTIKP